MRKLAWIAGVALGLVGLALAATAADARGRLDELGKRPVEDCNGLIPSHQSLFPADGTVSNGLTQHVMGYRAGSFFKLRRSWHGIAVQLVTERTEQRELFNHLSCRVRNYRTPPSQPLA